MNLETIIRIINLFFLISINLFFLIFSLSSLKEKEKKAAFLSISGFLFNSFLWGFFYIFHESSPVITINIIFIFIIIGFGIISLIKFFPPEKKEDLTNIKQFDERDHMFSRNILKFYPDIAQEYYKANPDKREIDQQIHEKPELCEEGSKFFDPLYALLPQAAFTYLERTINRSSGKSDKERKNIDRSKVTGIIKKTAYYYGAVDIGITKLKPYHYYSHSGRHYEIWGKKVKNSHTYGIVLVVAMDPLLFKNAPTLPILFESAKYYVEVSKISNIIAEYIRSLGYEARAHTDANYEVFCVPMAKDAGLGEVGRLGIFIHPVYGPCVRICVVTTNLELNETEGKNYHIENFCEICKKCADNCPTASINKEEKKSSRGFKHWFINQEACFSFWKTIGTDCGICIRACPYTKPNTLIHKLVRFYISRNTFNQRLALFLDDLFYGRKIKIKGENPDLDKIL